MRRFQVMAMIVAMALGVEARDTAGQAVPEPELYLPGIVSTADYDPRLNWAVRAGRSGGRGPFKSQDPQTTQRRIQTALLQSPFRCSLAPDVFLH